MDEGREYIERANILLKGAEKIIKDSIEWDSINPEKLNDFDACGIRGVNLSYRALEIRRRATREFITQCESLLAGPFIDQKILDDCYVAEKLAYLDSLEAIGIGAIRPGVNLITDSPQIHKNYGIDLHPCRDSGGCMIRNNRDLCPCSASGNYNCNTLDCECNCDINPNNPSGQSKLFKKCKHDS